MSLSNYDLRAKFYNTSTAFPNVRRCYDLVNEKSKKNDHLIGRARDLALLEWGCHNKYFDIFIAQKITKNPHDKNVYKQIAWLISQKFLKKIKMKGLPLYRVTSHGIKFFNRETGSENSLDIAKANCSSIFYSHTMVVQHALYTLFEKYPVGTKFLSEYDVGVLCSWLDRVEARIKKFQTLSLIKALMMRLKQLLLK